MGARILVSLVLVLLGLQPSPLAGAQSLDELWAQGRQLSRRGDYTAAQQFYAAVVDQVGAPAAPRGLLLQARAALADADTSTAEAVLQSLLDGYPGSDQEAGALFTLAQVRRAAGDCDGALRALAAYEAAAPGHPLGPYP